MANPDQVSDKAIILKMEALLIFAIIKKLKKNAIVWSKKGNRRVLCVFLMCTGKVPKEWKRPNDSPRVIWTRLVGMYLTQCCILLNDCRAIAVSWPEHIDVLDCMHLPHKIALEIFACALYCGTLQRLIATIEGKRTSGTLDDCCYTVEWWWMNIISWSKKPCIDRMTSAVGSLTLAKRTGRKR